MWQFPIYFMYHKCNEPTHGRAHDRHHCYRHCQYLKKKSSAGIDKPERESDSQGLGHDQFIQYNEEIRQPHAPKSGPKHRVVKSSGATNNIIKRDRKGHDKDHHGSKNNTL